MSRTFMRALEPSRVFTASKMACSLSALLHRFPFSPLSDPSAHPTAGAGSSPASAICANIKKVAFLFVPRAGGGGRSREAEAVSL